jgi:hypothetical protein
MDESLSTSIVWGFNSGMTITGRSVYIGLFQIGELWKAIACRQIVYQVSISSILSLVHRVKRA